MRLTVRGRRVLFGVLAVLAVAGVFLAVHSVPLPDDAGYDVPVVCFDEGLPC